MQRRTRQALPRLVETAGSGAFKPREGMTTTWGTTPDGDTVLLEQLADLPTHYPIAADRRLESGDYAAFVAAQMGGKGAAREYALRGMEFSGAYINSDGSIGTVHEGDAENTQGHRRAWLAAVRRRARQAA